MTGGHKKVLLFGGAPRKQAKAGGRGGRNSSCHAQAPARPDRPGQRPASSGYTNSLDQQMNSALLHGASLARRSASEHTGLRSSILARSYGVLPVLFLADLSAPAARYICTSTGRP